MVTTCGECEESGVYCNDGDLGDEEILWCHRYYKEVGELDKACKSS